MKLSAANVLLTASSASAFSASYLDQLAPGMKAPSGAGMTSYLDGISGEDQVPGLVTALEQASVAAPAAPVAQAAPAAGDYLGALNSGATTTSGVGMTSYLDTVSGAPSPLSGAGLTSYLDALPQNAASSLSGAGMTSYLDTMGRAAPAAASPPAPVAAASVSTPTVNDAPAAGDYLDALNTGARASGAGITTYLDALPPQIRAAGGAGLTGYLEVLKTNPSIAGAGITGYLDALAADGGTPGRAVESFLENIYEQIMALPEDGSRKVSGTTMAFAKVEEPYAMTFVKK